MLKPVFKFTEHFSGKKIILNQFVFSIFSVLIALFEAYANISCNLRKDMNDILV